MERKPISKKTRFEVFKRDSFKCVYCGASAPDVLLHIDHIKPVAEGGDNDLLNLVTACASCNQGKGARELSDNAVIEKRKAQLDELNERREQLEMMMEWQDFLTNTDDVLVEKIAEMYSELVPGWSLNLVGKNNLKSVIKKYGFNEVAESLRIAVNQYLEIENGEATDESSSKIIEYIEKIARVRYLQSKDPVLKDLNHVSAVAAKFFDRKLGWSDRGIIRSLLESGVSATDIMGSLQGYRDKWEWLNDIQEMAE